MDAPLAFIALDEGMLALARSTLAGRHDDVRLARGLMGEAVDVARRLAAEGVEAVVSRGATARLIAEGCPQLSVVDLSVSALDLATAIHRAGAAASRVGVVAFPAMAAGAEALGAMLGVEVHVRALAREDEVERHLAELRGVGVTTVVGGYLTARVAQRVGVACVPVQTVAASILAAVDEARRIVRARAIEKGKAALLRTVLACTDNGIVAVDGEGRVTVVNPAAGRMLRVEEADVLGRPVTSLLPHADAAALVAGGPVPVRQVHRLFDQEVMCTPVPIRAGAATVGAVLTLHDVRQIQRMEATVRKRILPVGHVAAARFEAIAGASPALAVAVAMARDFAATTSTVLVLGETGTGKELFAQGIHNASPRADGPFVAVNCAALPGQLLESELFGYVAGAFTGASQKGKAGLFELAHGGTIFLDEIAEVDPGTQGKLLRVLQERQVMRLGSDQVIPVDVRVVTATNRPLRALVEHGDFRADLYYRLNVLQLALPPLRDREGDVALLARRFLAQLLPPGREARLDDEALALLERHPWPGNVRELHNVVERLAATCRASVIGRDDVRPLLGDAWTGARSRLPDPADAIGEALAQSHGRVAEAAALLGISRSTLWRRMRRIGIAA